MSTELSVVAVYRTHTEADRAVKELQRGGVDMRKLSIVGKGYHTDEQVVGYYNTGDRMKYWGKDGCFLGRLLGASVRFRFFHDPGPRPHPGGGTAGGLDRGSIGRRGSGGRIKRSGRRPLQHRNSEGQHCEIRDRAANRSIPPGRSRHGCGSGQGEGHYRHHPSRLLHAAYGRSRTGIVFRNGRGGCGISLIRSENYACEEEASSG